MTYEGTAESDRETKRPLGRAVLVGLVVGIPASLVFLWFAFRNADVDAVWAAARSADLALVLAGCASLGAMYVLQAARWRGIAASPHPGRTRFVEMVLGAIACNNVLPGRIGEIFRARWLAVEAPMASGRALATVGLDRGCDVVVLFAFLAVPLPLVAPAAWVTRIAVGAALLVVLLATLLLAARQYARLRSRERRERGLVRRVARDVVDRLAEPMGRRLAARALALSVVAWGMFALAVWLVARSVGIELDPVDCVFVTGAINLGVAIPSSPGFVGTYQWLAVAALGVLGVTQESALAFSILLHASWYVPTTIVGGLLVVLRLRSDFRRR
jgi:glycosyltransferase 2 family protein